MITRLTRAIRKRRRHQGGFTLIELLVVITILGILAAIVSVSLLGITATARKNALATEKQTVQLAFDAMLHDQHVDPSQLTGCEVNASHTQPLDSDTNWTDLMTAFPPGGSTYTTPVAAADGKVTFLATHYLRDRVTLSAYYICDQEGNVYQKRK
jgi:prepilin-type N-terminal cleavage/methylation domain-containing protein